MFILFYTILPVGVLDFGMIHTALFQLQFALMFSYLYVLFVCITLINTFVYRYMSSAYFSV